MRRMTRSSVDGRGTASVRPGRRARLASVLFVVVTLLLQLAPPIAQGAPLAAPPTSPVLLVLDSTSPNPFGPYLGEILRAEGLNAFQTEQLANVTPAVLASFPQVILTQTSLSANQAS